MTTATITQGQRLVRTLTGQSVDRAPFGVGIGWAPWGETLARWREESGVADLDPAQVFGYEAGFSICPIEQGPVPHFEREVLQEDEAFVISRTAHGLTVRNRRDGTSMPEFIAHPLKSCDDWERYKAERLSGLLEERLAALEEYAAGMAGSDQPVQFGNYPFGLFGTARDLFGAEELLYLFYDEPEMVQDVMATLTDLWIRLLRAVHQRIPVSHVHIWEDMSGRQGSLISMAMVEEFMMPHYDRLTSACRELAIPLVSVDSDGVVDQLLATMLPHGVNMFFPFEQQCGNDLLEIRKAYPELAIVGGFDKNAVAAGGAALHREYDKVEEMLVGGRYIPGCDHLVPPTISWTQWQSFCREMKRLIGV
ncbi:MAG: uroporphyrinogen decarboxylase family protein [Planctomycetota bacterium]|jgi:uroporphyrinogen decarboxylase